MMMTRCGFVSIIGKPNTGKSTLLNYLIGEKVSIVSPKVQTTRREIRGIIEYNNSQIIFIDTPGICRANTPLEKVLLSNFRKAYKSSDIVLMLIDATNWNNSLNFLSYEKNINKPFIVAINKVDLINKKENLLHIANELGKYSFIQEIFMISAITGEGIDPIITYLQNTIPEGPWLYFKNHGATDLDIKLRLAEITRETVFEKLNQELPYNIYITTDKLHSTDKKFKIMQTIVVMSASQKGIVLGHKGIMIQSIKRNTIQKMKSIFNKTIELKLFVQVKEKWTERKDHLINAGII